MTMTMALHAAAIITPIWFVCIHTPHMFAVLSPSLPSFLLSAIMVVYVLFIITIAAGIELAVASRR